MKASKPTVGAIALVSIAAALPYAASVNSQQTAVTEQRSTVDNKTRRERLTYRGVIDAERRVTLTALPQPTEAPTGFDNQTNGFLPQGVDFGSIDEDHPDLATFNGTRFVFEEQEQIADGLGPTYNAQSCGECHQNVVTGGASQVTEHRTGYIKLNGDFAESPGGSLVHSRATYADIVERVRGADVIRTFRISTNTLGDGFVECISNSTLLGIRAAQPASLRGNAVLVAVLEADGLPRIGRFGWKNQHASLESFAADAYLNEMGITSPLFPQENTSMGKTVDNTTRYDPLSEPEDDGEDVKAFANFMRSTKAPARGPVTAGVPEGEQLFKSVGCAYCHTPTIVTAPPGTPINGGKFIVPPQLGNKIIHPYSDFLMHDVGTGDGIPLLPTSEHVGTATQMRTAPLWGLRTRNRLMHDGLTFTTQDAILRHAGQATSVTNNYKVLSATQKARLLEFLDSL